MAASQPLPELVHAAQKAAKASQERISQILQLADGQPLSGDQLNEIRSETTAMELAAVDIFTVFEARMQRHFKRGPLSRKVEAALLAAGHAELADRLHQYYLAVNVLKHGSGASHRELLASKSAMLTVARPADRGTEQDAPSASLVDVTSPDFFDSLAQTILGAYEFLEKKRHS